MFADFPAILHWTISWRPEWNSQSSEYLLHRKNLKKKKKIPQADLILWDLFHVPVKFILLGDVRFMFGLKVLLQPKWFYDFVCLLLNALLLYSHCRQELCFSPWRARGEDIALYVLFLKPSIFLTEFWNKKARSLVLKIKIHIDIWTHIYIISWLFWE